MTGPPTADRERIERLRDRLDALGYTAEGVRTALGTAEEVLSRARDIPVHVRRLRDAGTLGAVIRLFILDLAVPRPELAAAMAPLPVALLEDLGLARVDGDDVVPLARIVPHDDLLIASDRRLAPGEAAPHDHVPGVNRPSVTLAHLTVRASAATALDVGTGCGIEALLMARHAVRVVATDVSPRAIAYARTNALLNRVTNIETRVGSWFEPVAGERFDLAVCNPPYVISPETQYVYRDSGLPGDTVSERVLRDIPSHLVEGGFATVMVSWVVRDAGDVAAPVRSWIDGSHCDAWILRSAIDDPLATARMWNEADAALDPVAYGDALDRWLAYYAAHAIEAVAYGSVVLRRRATQRNWVRVDELPPGRVGPASDQILRVFAAQDHLAQLSRDEGLLDERLRVVERHHVDERRRIGDEGRDRSIAFSLDEGIGSEADIDGLVLMLLERLSDRTVREAVLELAQERGIGSEQLGGFVRSALGTIRQMYAAGMLARDVTLGAARS